MRRIKTFCEMKLEPDFTSAVLYRVNIAFRIVVIATTDGITAVNINTIPITFSEKGRPIWFIF